MKFFRLHDLNAWNGECIQMVIRASNEEEARKMAERHERSGMVKWRTVNPSKWLDKRLTDCIELPIDGNSEVVASLFFY